MRFYGKAEAVAEQIVTAFQSGNLPAALSAVYVHRKDDVPCRRWSITNQILAAIAGTTDARGYRQWQEVGRNVKKGSKAFHILAPIIKKRTGEDEQTGEERERSVIVGFKSCAVFRYEDTEGEPLPEADPAATAFIDSLPLVDVARRWGLTVTSYNGRSAGALGKYRHGEAIALGVENLATWAHELVHAAEDRLGNLTRRPGQQTDNEIVAELGGAVLLECLGRHDESDRGGAWQYVRSYAEAEGKDAAGLCMRYLNRVADAVNLILTDAAEIGAEEPFEV